MLFLMSQNYARQLLLSTLLFKTSHNKSGKQHLLQFDLYNNHCSLRGHIDLPSTSMEKQSNSHYLHDIGVNTFISIINTLITRRTTMRWYSVSDLIKYS